MLSLRYVVFGVGLGSEMTEYSQDWATDDLYPLLLCMSMYAGIRNSNLSRFSVQDYRPGVAFSDLQEGPEAALAPPLPSRSSRARAGKIPIVVQPGGGAAIQPMLGNEFTRKGSESATVGLGFAGSNEDDAHRDDVFSAYRRMRSTSYHSTIAREVLEKRQNRR